MVVGPSEIFIGREAELAELGALLGPPHAGGLVLAAGEAGVGKSRLVAEALDRAGGRTAWSACWEGDGAPAYWPWVQVIRACLAMSGGEEWRLAGSPSVGEVLALLPEQEVPSLAADASRFRLFEGVVDLVRAAAAEDGMVLVFDDLQWSDEASIQLLVFAVRSLSDDPVVVAGTYRDDEISLEHPLRTAMAELAGLVRHLHLGGLAREELAVLVQSQIGWGDELTAELAAELAAELQSMTGGNPFFAREVLALVRSGSSRDGRAGRPRVPASVRAVIERRLARLSNDCEDALKLAAVIGSPFPVGLLAAALGKPEDAVLAVLDEAASAEIVHADGESPRQLRFGHDLLRETIYSATAPAERARAHARVATVLDAAGDEASPTRTASLAHHLLAAGPLVEPATALTAVMRAGDRALSVLAYEEAADWYARALALSRAGELDTAEVIAVLLALGEARVRHGDLPGARSVYVEAADLASQHDRPDDLARAALGLGSGLGGFEISLFDHVQIDLLERALGALPRQDSPSRAQLLARLSVALSLVAAGDRRLALSVEAVEMARHLDDGASLGHALAAYCDAIAGPEHSERRRDTAREVVEVGSALGDRRLELLGRRHLIVALLELGEMAEVDDQIRAFAVAAEVLREPLYRWYVPLWRGMRALMAGRTAESASLCDEASALGELAHSDNAAMLTLTQRWVRLRADDQLDDAGRLVIEQGLTVFGELPGLTVLGALCQLHTGRTEEASAALAGLRGDLERLPRDAEWLPTMAQAAEVAAALGDRDVAGLLDGMMAPFDHRVVVEGIGAGVYGTLGGFRARLAALLGRVDEAARLASEAAAAADRMGLRCAPKLAPAAPHARMPAPAATELTASLQREGDLWAVTFAGVTARVRHAKGVQDLAALLARPGAAVHVTELISPDPATQAAASSRGDDVLDRRALAAYRRRLAELDDDLAEAESHQDVGRATKLRVEREFLVAELAGSVGLGGRVRRAGDDVDRARKTVRARVRDAIRRVEAAHPPLGRHLSLAVRTGTYCSYQPESPVRWTVEQSTARERGVSHC